MKIFEMEQRSEEWAAIRLGKLTGSRAAEMLSSRKDATEAAGRRNLRVQLMLERLTGRSHENGYESRAMKNGTDREVDAVAVYEAMTGNLLSSVGFVQHDSLMAGCSPDGYVNDWEGLIEVKSPIPATHLDYLKTGLVPGEYLKQIMHGLWLTGAKWCDWLSYQPDFPEPLQTKLVRVHRDEKAIAEYEVKVKAFLAEVDAELQSVQELMAVTV